MHIALQWSFETLMKQPNSMDVVLYVIGKCFKIRHAWFLLLAIAQFISNSKTREYDFFFFMRISMYKIINPLHKINPEGCYYALEKYELYGGTMIKVGWGK